MSERTNKIVVNPRDVRVWGNVVPEANDKSSFTQYKCTLSNKGVSTVDGRSRSTFLVNSFLETILSFDTPLEEWYNSWESLRLKATLKTVRNELMKNAIVKLYVDNVQVSSGRTDNYGKVFLDTGLLEKGSHTLKFGFDGGNTRGSSTTSSSSIYSGLDITLGEVDDYYWMGQGIPLSATLTKYGLGTGFQGLCTFTIMEYVNDEDHPNTFTYKNVESNSSGVATVNPTIITPGFYKFKVNVYNETSEWKLFYIVDFDKEFNDFLIWYNASSPTGTGQYEGIVDIRDAFNQYLSCLNSGSINPVYDLEVIEMIDGVMQKLHEYYNE